MNLLLVSYVRKIFLAPVPRTAPLTHHRFRRNRMWIPFPSGAAHPVRRIGRFWWERLGTFWRFGCLGFGTSWWLRDPLTPILYYVFGVGTLYPANPGSHYRECASTSTSRVGAVWPHDGGGRYRIFYISCFLQVLRGIIMEEATIAIVRVSVL